MKNYRSGASFVKKRMIPIVTAIDRHAQALFRSSGPRHLHQVRVMIRRLRNNLKVFGGFFLSGDTGRWDRDLKELSKTASEARDLDVMIGFLDQYAAGLKKKEGRPIRGLADDIRRRRDGMQPDIVASLRRMKDRNILAEITAVLQDPGFDRGVPFEEIYAVGLEKIDKRIRKLLAFERYVDRPRSMAALHRMRIANKHLRYTLECLRPAYSREMDSFLTDILAFHRVLGLMHDCDVWERTLAGMSPGRGVGAGHQPAVNNLKSCCGRKRRECYNIFRRSWHRKREGRLFEELLGYIRSAISR